MDRAAKLAAVAEFYLAVDGLFEKPTEESRATVRGELAEIALMLGFAPNEISAAIDEALTAAGATP